jgi:hypothetical protein
MHRLRRLSLRGCEVGGRGDGLARLPLLTHLDLAHTSVCDAALHALAVAHPQLTALALDS